MNHSIEIKSACIQLLKSGAITKEDSIWPTLIDNQELINQYFDTLNLYLFLDTNDGYCILKEKEIPEDIDLPFSLMEKRKLTYYETLLCVILRKKILESDLHGDNERAIITTLEMTEALGVFLQEATNEAKLIDRCKTMIKKAVDLKLLTPLKSEDEFEVNRIIKAKLDANLIAEIETRMRAHVKSII